MRETFPASELFNRLYTNPFFDRKKNKSIEVCDAVIDYGDSLVLIEHKGGYLSAKEKYSDDVDILIRAVGEKFGLKKGVHQLTRSIGLLFNSSQSDRDTFSEVGANDKRANRFSLEELRRVRKVYPVMVVQDFALANGFMNRRLRSQLADKLRDYAVDDGIHIRPLSLLTVENLENVLAHTDTVTLTSVLDEYASEKHEPRSTFNDIFNDFLASRQLDVKRRYGWSVRRCEQIVSSIHQHFINTST